MVTNFNSNAHPFDRLGGGATLTSNEERSRKMPQSRSVRRYRNRLEAALALIETIGDPAIFTRLYVASARSAADAADSRLQSGGRFGPLDGEIVTIKDLFDVAGEPTTAGSAILRSAPAAVADAVVVRRLREAGAIILGKTNMTEFAYSGLGLNPHWGTPRNAVTRDCIPGGSSSGAGVSVALGIADLAIGTDTGGSVRIPASLNGVVGFKPTADRVPRDGVFPLSPSHDSVGSLARSVQACADADAVMAGQAPAPVKSAALTSVRFGVVADYLADVDPAVLHAFGLALRALERGHAIVREASVGDLVAEMHAILSDAPIVPFEAAHIHAERVATRSDDFDPEVLGRIRRGQRIAEPQYLLSLRRRDRLIAAMDQRLRDWDCLILPTTPRTAPLLTEVANPQAFKAMNALMLRNPAFANFFDLCAISIPMPVEPMPAGVMLVGRHGTDEALLSIARAVEKELWKSARASP
jgi:aspartyl-tRNA(Asn)/glutamyl-tRNA(Gln) amidotransferase subunit A